MASQLQSGLRETCRGLLLREIDEVTAAAQEWEAKAVGARVGLPPAKSVTVFNFDGKEKYDKKKMLKRGGMTKRRTMHQSDPHGAVR